MSAPRVPLAPRPWTKNVMDAVAFSRRLLDDSRAPTMKPSDTEPNHPPDAPAPDDGAPAEQRRLGKADPEGDAMVARFSQQFREAYERMERRHLAPSQGGGPPEEASPIAPGEMAPPSAMHHGADEPRVEAPPVIVPERTPAQIHGRDTNPSLRRVKERRNLLAIGAGIGFGALLVTVFWVAFIRSSQTEPQPPAAAASTAQPPVPSATHIEVVPSARPAPAPSTAPAPSASTAPPPVSSHSQRAAPAPSTHSPTRSPEKTPEGPYRPDQRLPNF